MKSDVAYKENMFDHDVPKLGDNEVDMTKYFFYKVGDDMFNWVRQQ